MVVAKLMNPSYYWPGMLISATEAIQKCHKSQKHAPKTLRPKNNLVIVTSAWPFQKWGIDIVGQFSKAPGGSNG